MNYGDPRCTLCRGRGYTRTYGRVTRCGCVRPTREEARMVKRANTRADRPPMTMAEMLRAGSSERRRADG